MDVSVSAIRRAIRPTLITPVRYINYTAAVLGIVLQFFMLPVSHFGMKRIRALQASAQQKTSLYE
jgi:hypothetical protein